MCLLLSNSYRSSGEVTSNERTISKWRPEIHDVCVCVCTGTCTWPDTHNRALLNLASQRLRHIFAEQFVMTSMSYIASQWSLKVSEGNPTDVETKVLGAPAQAPTGRSPRKGVTNQQTVQTNKCNSWLGCICFWVREEKCIQAHTLEPALEILCPVCIYVCERHAFTYRNHIIIRNQQWCPWFSLKITVSHMGNFPKSLNQSPAHSVTQQMCPG